MKSKLMKLKPGVLFLMLLPIMFSCEKSMVFEAEDSELELNSPLSQTDKRDFTSFETSTTELIPVDQKSNAVQSASTIYYKNSRKYYHGTTVYHPSGASLWIDKDSFLPPSYITWGTNVEITMSVEKDLKTNELIYTFGPSGSHFSPSATLWISWHDLGTETADLFYIDPVDGYVQQEPEDVDYEGKRLKITIDHFSRYAVAYGR